MIIARPLKEIIAFKQRGFLGKPNYYDEAKTAELVALVGEERATKIINHYNAQKGIYQQRRVGKRKVTVKYAFYTYNTTRTEARGTCRDKFKAGMLAWKALDDETKKQWWRRSSGKRMTACNMFLHCYMLDLP